MDGVDFRKDDVVTVDELKVDVNKMAHQKGDELLTIATIENVELSISKIAKASNFRNVARFFDVFLNNMGRDGYRSGKESGSLLRTTHRTLQRSFICWCIGALGGIADQEHADARNIDALNSAKKISKMVESGDINMGAFI